VTSIRVEIRLLVACKLVIMMTRNFLW